MTESQDTLFELQEIAKHPRRQLEKYLMEGKKVVGCFPIYVPEEIIHAAGFIPMGMWGGQITPTVAGKYNPIFTCSIMRSCLEFGMMGTYQGLSCVAMPILCDTFRGMSSGWRAGVKDIPIATLIQPQNRTDPGAREFLVAEYEEFAKTLASLTDSVVPSEDALQKSIEIYNAHSNIMMEFTCIANEHLDVITPVLRHAVMKSALMMPKEEHTLKVQTIITELKKQPQHRWKGKKVILTGITAEPDEFLTMFSENNIAVVGDDLAQESRLYRTPIPSGKNAMERLAGQWFGRHGCSVVHETHFTRGKMLVDMARKFKAEGIAVCLMRFCDVEEYDYPLIAKDAEAAKLYCLCLEIDQSTQNNEQSRTKLQSFAEME